MIDHFIEFVIRPPRAEYVPERHLWDKEFTLAQRKYLREDLELTNERGQKLKCSHYVPAKTIDNAPLPCVIYCHGNSGCRVEAKEAAVLLLPLNITVFTLDFSGSGLSDGEYVSLGWHEKNDLKVVVTYLRSTRKASRIGLWGRSMGAVTSLLYGAEDPSIAGMVLDSAFSNLFNLMVELADLYDVWVPKFTVKMVLLYMRRVIQKKAKFDILRVDCMKVARRSFAPALFAHGEDDRLILPMHSENIFNDYMGEKHLIKFDGDHNSTRPKYYYESVSKFFFDILHPPRLSSSHAKHEKNCDLRDLKFGAGSAESILPRSVSAGAASSSSATRSFAGSKYLIESDLAALRNFKIENDKSAGTNDDTQSLTSSTRECWGSYQSMSGDEALSQDCTHIDQMPAPPIGDSHRKDRRKMKNKAPSGRKKSKHEKLEALSQRFRFCCFLKSPSHKRLCSSSHSKLVTETDLSV